MYQQIESLIGNTPMVRIRRLHSRSGVTVLGKMEGNNPGGSVKDRPAFWMFRTAEKQKLLVPGITIIEATSGNTGIALALIAAIKGYDIELAMPENSTVERVKAMRSFGAKITLTPAKTGMEGAIDYVNQRLQEPGYIMLNQFANSANPQAHYETTGPEIWRDTQGGITHFVSAMGTTGTIMGVSHFLKEQNPDIQIIGVQPTEGSQIPGIRKWPEAYLPKIYDRSRIDRIIQVTRDEAVATTRMLSQKEGISCGMSAGGAMHVALKLAESLPDGATVVSIICDRGDRYLSTDLFD